MFSQFIRTVGASLYRLRAMAVQTRSMSAKALSAQHRAKLKAKIMAQGPDFVAFGRDKASIAYWKEIVGTQEYRAVWVSPESSTHSSPMSPMSSSSVAEQTVGSPTTESHQTLTNREQRAFFKTMMKFGPSMDLRKFGEKHLRFFCQNLQHPDFLAKWFGQMPHRLATVTVTNPTPKIQKQGKLTKAERKALNKLKGPTLTKAETKALKKQKEPKLTKGQKKALRNEIMAQGPAFHSKGIEPRRLKYYNLVVSSPEYRLKWLSNQRPTTTSVHQPAAARQREVSIGFASLRHDIAARSPLVTEPVTLSQDERETIHKNMLRYGPNLDTSGFDGERIHYCRMIMSNPDYQAKWPSQSASVATSHPASQITQQPQIVQKRLSEHAPIATSSRVAPTFDFNDLKLWPTLPTPEVKSPQQQQRPQEAQWVPQSPNAGTEHSSHAPDASLQHPSTNADQLGHYHVNHNYNVVPSQHSLAPWTPRPSPYTTDTSIDISIMEKPVFAGHFECSKMSGTVSAMTPRVQEQNVSDQPAWNAHPYPAAHHPGVAVNDNGLAETERLALMHFHPHSENSGHT